MKMDSQKTTAFFVKRHPRERRCHIPTQETKDKIVNQFITTFFGYCDRYEISRQDRDHIQMILQMADDRGMIRKTVKR